MQLQKLTSQAQEAIIQAMTLDPQQALLARFIDEGHYLMPCYRLLIRSDGSLLHHRYGQNIVKHLVSNQSSVDITTSTAVSRQALIDPITPKEMRVLNLVAQGMSNREVADQISVSVETVKSHLKSIYSKMGVNRRTQAVSLARELNLLS